MPYSPTIYDGAAAHYRSGRPAYSPAFEVAIAEEAGLDGRGRLLDVGCGPGTLAVRLAGLFDAVVGLDPDAEMLTEGRLAGRAARADEYPMDPGVGRGPSGRRARAVPDGDVRSILSLDGRTARGGGRLRHPRARRRVGADRAHGQRAAAAAWPRTSTDPSRGDPTAGGPSPRIQPPRRPGRQQPADAPLRGCARPDALGEPRVLFLPGIPDLVRDSESVLSGYLSLASSAPHLFPDGGTAFAEEVRGLLAQRSPHGVFWDWPGRHRGCLGTEAPGRRAG